MADFTLNATLGPTSLKRLQALAAYPELLEPELLVAMNRGLDILRTYASDYMWIHFIGPTGGAEGSWEEEIVSPYEAWLGNTAPYAQRLNFGFSQRFDSLNRYFTAWPLAYPDGYHWAEHTVEDNSPEIDRVIATAIRTANKALESSQP